MNGLMHQHRNGFTLIELSVVLVIISLIVGSTLLGATSILRSAKVKEAREELTTIQEAMNEYLQKHSHIPCVSSLVNAPDTASFGRSAETCDDTTDGNTTVSGTVHFGGVPWRNLGLHPNYAIDPWGNRYLYAMVTNHGNNSALYSANNGSITIEDAGGNTLTSEASYVILSHGKDAEGAYTYQTGALVNACNTGGGTDALNLENCDGDTTFVDTTYNDGDTQATYFDDLVVWAEKGVSGSVIIFAERPGTIRYYIGNATNSGSTGDFTDLDDVVGAGIQAANEYCQEQTVDSTSRMATIEDLYRSGTVDYPTSTAWIGGMDGHWGGFAVTNCLGWTSDNGTYIGGGVASDGEIGPYDCDRTHQIACYTP